MVEQPCQIQWLYVKKGLSQALKFLLIRYQYADNWQMQAN